MGYVIVLDPGHGGEEDGGMYGNYVEKNLNLAVANAMKAYLEKFDGVTVYLTRYDDTTLSLQQRQDIAKSLNADYVICLHFNLSSYHNLYGSEVWIPAQKNFYNKTYPMANEFIKKFEEKGLHIRGIKTRLNSKGDNYYGILRIGTNYNIPTILVEHAHMDNANDNHTLPPQAQALSAACADYGVQDADAVARSLHLKSTALGVDYSGYKLSTYKTNKAIVSPDESEPEICEISLVSVKEDFSQATINIHASDKQSFIQYYMVSMDGGNTYSMLRDYPRTTWNKSYDDCVVTLDMPKSKTADIVVAVFNQYDKITLSNHLFVTSQSNNVTMNTSGFTHTEKLSTGRINNDSLFYNDALFTMSFTCTALFALFISILIRKLKIK